MDSLIQCLFSKPFLSARHSFMDGKFTKDPNRPKAIRLQGARRLGIPDQVICRVPLWLLPGAGRLLVPALVCLGAETR